MSIQKEKYLLNFPVNEHFDFFPDSSNVNHAGQQQQDESIWGRCIWNTYFLGFEEWCCFVLKKKKKKRCCFVLLLSDCLLVSCLFVSEIKRQS